MPQLYQDYLLLSIISVENLRVSDFSRRCIHELSPICIEFLTASISIKNPLSEQNGYRTGPADYRRTQDKPQGDYPHVSRHGRSTSTRECIQIYS
jgi:hypothetical protein